MRNLESVIRHDLRLTILGNLAYGGPCNARELRERVGVGITEIAYHLAVLRSHGLVVTDKEEEMYTATLSDHPDWVEEAVTAHRLALRISLGLSEPANLRITCTLCTRLLNFKEKIVVVYDDDGVIRAKVITEEALGSGETGELHVTDKYHPGCYEQARRRGKALPEVKEVRPPSVRGKYDSKYDSIAVGRALLFEVIARDAKRPKITELVGTVVGDQGDDKEVETARRALRELREAALIACGDDERVEPTRAALHADRLFGAV
jgi:DNA-binding transcriptional ArsR family regulator